MDYNQNSPHEENQPMEILPPGTHSVLGSGNPVSVPDKISLMPLQETLNEIQARKVERDVQRAVEDAALEAAKQRAFEIQHPFGQMLAAEQAEQDTNARINQNLLAFKQLDAEYSASFDACLTHAEATTGLHVYKIAVHTPGLIHAARHAQEATRLLKDREPIVPALHAKIKAYLVEHPHLASLLPERLAHLADGLIIWGLV